MLLGLPLDELIASEAAPRWAKRNHAHRIDDLVPSGFFFYGEAQLHLTLATA